MPSSEVARGHAVIEPQLSRDFGRNLSQQLQGTGEAIKQAGMTLTKAVTLPIAAAVGGVITAGVTRLSSLQESQHTLKTLNLTTKETTKLTDDLQDSLIGTAFTLDDASAAMTRMVASGVELKEVDNVMKLMLDTAAFGKRPLGEIAFVFERIQTQGKLTGESLNMLVERVPGGLKQLAEAADVTGEEFREMVSAGEVSAEDFIDLWTKASESGSVQFEGMAQSMDQTIKGALSSLMGFFSLYSAQVVEASGLFEGLHEMTQNTLDVFKDPQVNEDIKAFGDTLGEAFNLGDLGGLTESLPNALRNITSFLGDLEPDKIRGFAKQLGIMAGLGPGLILVGVAIKAIGAAIGIATTLSGPVGLIVAAVAGLVFGVSQAFKESEQFREAVGRLWGVLQDDLLPAVNNLVSAFGDLFGFDWENIGDVLATVTDNITDSVETISGGIQIAANNLETLGDDIEEHGGFWEALAATVEDTGTTIKETLSGILTSFVENVPGAQVMLNVLTTAIQTVQGVFEFLGDRISFVWNDILKPVFQNIGSVFKQVVEGVIQPVANFFSELFTGVIVPIVRWFFNTVWKPILDSIGSAWNALYDNILQPVATKITDTWETLEGVISSVWEGIREGASTAWNATAGIIENAINWIIDTAWNNGMRRVIQGIGNALNIEGLDVPEFDPISVPRLGGSGGGREAPHLFGPGTGVGMGSAEKDDPKWLLQALANEKEDKTGGPFDDLFDKAKDLVLGTALGPARSLLSNALDNLNFPDNIIGRAGKALMTKVIDAVLGTVKDEDEAASVVPSAGGEASGSLGQFGSGIAAIVTLVRSITDSLGIPMPGITSSFRPGDPGWHGQGRAVDFGGYNQDRLAAALMARGGSLLELIHLSPKGAYGVKNGRINPSWYSSLFASGNDSVAHRDHIHVAMDNGGVLPPGVTTVFNGTGQPELVTPVDKFGGLDGPFTVKVFMNEREITDRVEIAVEQRDSRLAREVG